jgi:transcription initiation factor IIE alpha subunit
MATRTKIKCPRCKTTFDEATRVGMHPDFPFVCESCDESQVEHDDYGGPSDDEYSDW